MRRWAASWPARGGRAGFSHRVHVALAFTAWARSYSLDPDGRKGRVPHEAIIGIVYVVAPPPRSSRPPRSARSRSDSDVLQGSIIWVTWPTIAKKTIAYAGLDCFTMSCASVPDHLVPPDEAERRGGHQVVDFWFYISFGLAVTSRCHSPACSWYSRCSSCPNHRFLFTRTSASSC